MEQNHTSYLISTQNQIASSEFEDSFYEARQIYSMSHVRFVGSLSQQMTLKALDKSFEICRLAGIKSKHHFKKVFIFDATIGTILIDWQMSKTGFSLMMIEISSADEKLELWLRKLAVNKFL
ncbi:MAG: hypothetical protein H7282_17755 [Cytophagaceae bacterium]|nr:hypothetical protein [Cytophagaceae bacterium]